MKVTAFIRSEMQEHHDSSTVTIYIRFRNRKYNHDFKVATELKILPAHWSSELQGYKHKITSVPMIQQIQFNVAIRELKNLIETEYDYKTANQRWLADLVSKFHQSKDNEDLAINTDSTDEINKPEGLFEDSFNLYISKQDVSQGRIARYHVLLRALLRYELYLKINKTWDHKKLFTIKDITTNFLEDFWLFLVNEYEYIDKYPEIYELLPENRKPKGQRGLNTVITIFKILRAFIHWCDKNNINTVQPFLNFKIKSESYGTPYYLSMEERDIIYNLDLSTKPSLAIQRDIFIFQCLIGCRISDLYMMSQSNVIEGGIEYIAEKTKGQTPRTIRVPLNQKALTILNRYKDCTERLFPFIAQQNYNYAIKEILTIAGITRNVPIIDPKTGETTLRPLNEIASSHIARRTFIGNLYKQVKDPNLVGSLSGHVEGSKAFARYRTIDEDMRKELVNLIN